MYLKALVPTGLFGACAVGSYCAAMAPLASTSIDEDFYHDLNLLSRFDSRSVGYRGSIESDDMDVRSYLFNSSFNLVWRSRTRPEESVSGNAFLLNLLIPDWMDDHHPDRRSYAPKGHIAGDEAVLLLGTSFSFARTLFDRVGDWAKAVNCWDISRQAPLSGACDPVPLSSNSSASGTHRLLFSHPWPTADEGTRKLGQHHSYILGDETYAAYGSDVRRPHYFGLEPENVEAVYAAVDLSVNGRLMNLPLSSRDRLLRSLEHIHRYQPTSWRSGVHGAHNRRHQMAVDFAVLKVKFPVAHLKHGFLEHLIGAYAGRTVIPKVMDTHLEIRNERTGPMFMGGWEEMTLREVEQHTMSHLYVGAESCPPHPTPPTLKIYDTRGVEGSSGPRPSSGYEIAEQDSRYSHADGDGGGHWFVRYRIRTKGPNPIVSDEAMDLICVPENSAASGADPGLRTHREMQMRRNRKLLEFLESRPRAHARWREYGVRYSHFPFENIQTDVFNRTLLLPSESPSAPDQTKTADIFTVGDRSYINIAHHLDIPNMYLRSGKGLVSIMGHPSRSEKVMVGMYDGVSEWTNPLSGQRRYVGKVALFISPLRYDLFNRDNSLSRPSLGDVLHRRGLGDRLVQSRRFRTR